MATTRQAPGHSLTVRVALLDGPGLWCWELRDPADGRLIESSWTTHWMAFPSREEAEAAGRQRLAEIVARATGARGGPPKPGGAACCEARELTRAVTETA